MLVKELIEKLQQFPPDAEAFTQDEFGHLWIDEVSSIGEDRRVVVIHFGRLQN